MTTSGTNLSRLFEITTFNTSPLRMFQEKNSSDRLIDLAAHTAGCSGLIALVHYRSDYVFFLWNVKQFVGDGEKTSSGIGYIMERPRYYTPSRWTDDAFLQTTSPAHAYGAFFVGALSSCSTTGVMGGASSSSLASRASFHSELRRAILPGPMGSRGLARGLVGVALMLLILSVRPWPRRPLLMLRPSAFCLFA
jgi:hypothetical protein